jgi:iron complex outermembrane receptor protein
VAPSTGFPGSRYVNAGEVRNRGVELLLRVRPLEARHIGWDLTLNLSANDNTILSLGGLPTIGTTSTAPGGPVAEHREGYAPYSFFVKKVVQADFDAVGATVNVMCDGGPENNHQPMGCDVAPRVYVGKIQPDAQGSLRSGITLLGRVRLDALFDFQTGKTNFAEDDWVRCSVYRICHENFEPLLFDPIRVAEIERAGAQPIRSVYYNDASFIKFRELSLNYTFPDGVARKLAAQRASISVAGRNLYTWTKWTQLDPESSSLPLPGGGFDQSQMPQLAQATVLIRLTF